MKVSRARGLRWGWRELVWVVPTGMHLTVKLAVNIKLKPEFLFPLIQTSAYTIHFITHIGPRQALRNSLQDQNSTISYLFFLAFWYSPSYFCQRGRSDSLKVFTSLQSHIQTPECRWTSHASPPSLSLTGYGVLCPPWTTGSKKALTCFPPLLCHLVWQEIHFWISLCLCHVSRCLSSPLHVSEAVPRPTLVLWVTTRSQSIIKHGTEPILTRPPN